MGKQYGQMLSDQMLSDLMLKIYETLVQPLFDIWFNGEWRFYCGCADSRVASAFCRPGLDK